MRPSRCSCQSVHYIGWLPSNKIAPPAARLVESTQHFADFEAVARVKHQVRPAPKIGADDVGNRVVRVRGNV